MGYSIEGGARDIAAEHAQDRHDHEQELRKSIYKSSFKRAAIAGSVWYGATLGLLSLDQSIANITVAAFAVSVAAFAFRCLFLTNLQPDTMSYSAYEKNKEGRRSEMTPQERRDTDHFHNIAGDVLTAGVTTVGLSLAGMGVQHLVL